jgi:hypothetical protein
MFVQTADIDKVDTTRQHELGSLYLETNARSDDGPRVWVYVFNDEASAAFAAGDIVIRDPSVTTEKMFGVIQAPATNAAANFSVVGVAQHAIAAGSYGWVLARGKGLLRTGTGNVSADTCVVSGGTSAGCAKDATAGTDDYCIVGFSIEAEATDNTTFDAYINCLGAGV